MKQQEKRKYTKKKSSPLPYELVLNMSKWLDDLRRESITKQTRSEIECSNIYINS